MEPLSCGFSSRKNGLRCADGNLGQHVSSLLEREAGRGTVRSWRGHTGTTQTWACPGTPGHLRRKAEWSFCHMQLETSYYSRCVGTGASWESRQTSPLPSQCPYSHCPGPEQPRNSGRFIFTPKDGAFLVSPLLSNI